MIKQHVTITITLDEPMGQAEQNSIEDYLKDILAPEYIHFHYEDYED